MSSTISNKGNELSFYGMKSGDGPLSYSENSSYQAGVLDVARPFLEEEIATKLEISNNQNGLFFIADFGCSTGRNSFRAMHIIIEAIKHKHQSLNLKIPEFHVFFNDVVANDFNTLFRSLPPNRSYSVAAVPGDFHHRLLPPSSLHFAFSSCSLHWLTKVPKAVVEVGSPAWNGGEILYTKDRKEVCDAYLDQFERDMESFLNCRAVEMVDGGLMALQIPGEPPFWDQGKEYTAVSAIADPLRSCLMDMAIKGKVGEAEIDSFNMPFYLPTLHQLKVILERSHDFTIERMEILNKPNLIIDAAAFRALLEPILAHRFGVQVMDELFDLYQKKLVASPVFDNIENDKTVSILVVLKRTID